MVEVYWSCFIGGALLALVIVIFGDLLGGVFDGLMDFFAVDGFDFFHPMTLVGGITVFGGMGILLSQYTALTVLTIMLISFSTAVIIAILMYFFYIKPMHNSENSIGFSIQEHVGKLAEVITPIPVSGYGEVLIKAGIGYTNEMACSFEGDEIEAGAKVVVIEVKESALLVSRFDDLPKETYA